MDRDDIAAAARDRGLEAALAAFPDEVAAALDMARTQREALLAMPLDPSEAP